MPAKMTVVNGVNFPTSSDKLAEDALLQKLDEFHAHANELFARYASALAVGGGPLNTAMHNPTGSFAVRFTSAISENARRPFPDRKSLTELAGIAGELHLEKPCAEPMRVAAFPKSKEGWHRVRDSGTAKAVAQCAAFGSC
jgi:hypothetical protein